MANAMTPKAGDLGSPDKPGADPFGLRQLSLEDKIVVIREPQAENFNTALAGGVLIAPGKLTDFCPLYTQGGSEAIVS